MCRYGLLWLHARTAKRQKLVGMSHQGNYQIKQAQGGLRQQHERRWDWVMGYLGALIQGDQPQGQGQGRETFVGHTYFTLLLLLLPVHSDSFFPLNKSLMLHRILSVNRILSEPFASTPMSWMSGQVSKTGVQEKDRWCTDETGMQTAVVGCKEDSYFVVSVENQQLKNGLLQDLMWSYIWTYLITLIFHSTTVASDSDNMLASPRCYIGWQLSLCMPSARCAEHLDLWVRP